MERKDTPNPGEVTSITWGKGTKPSQVSITVKDVTQAGTWHATYSWDGDDKTLTLNTPVPGPSVDPPDIRMLKIESWGCSELDTPLEWTGAQSGVVNIVFQDGPHTSGPVGGIIGP